MSFVILPTSEKKAVSELTSNDKYELASALVEREFFMNVSYMVSEVQDIANQCEAHFNVSEELLEIAYEEMTEDPESACKNEGWKKATDLTPLEVYTYCAGENINELYELADCRGIDKVYINLKDDSFDYAVCDWEELAENQGIDLEMEPLETLEYWAITPWLASKLDNTVETLGMHIWGRTCSGQAIALDSDIQDLAVELASFEG